MHRHWEEEQEIQDPIPSFDFVNLSPGEKFHLSVSGTQPFPLLAGNFLGNSVSWGSPLSNTLTARWWRPRVPLRYIQSGPAGWFLVQYDEWGHPEGVCG